MKFLANVLPLLVAFTGLASAIPVNQVENALDIDALQLENRAATASPE